MAAAYASRSTAAEVDAAVDQVGTLLEPPAGGASVNLTVAQLQLVAGVLATLHERLTAEARRHLSSD